MAWAANQCTDAIRSAMIFSGPFTEIPVAFPIKVCVVCSEEFELKPGKPGFANRCPSCSEEDQGRAGSGGKAADGPDRELNEARKKAMRDLLYRKDA